MSGRRLIGIDLAWGSEEGTDYYSPDCEGSGCAELIRDGDDLTLKRLDLLYSMDEIVKWIKPERGDWVVAVDAPIVIQNEEGRRPAEDEADEFYGPYQAAAYSSNLNLAVGKSRRGGQLLTQLRKRGGDLVESAAHLEGQRLVFETYPHIVMVELFRLRRTIKYKGDNSADQLAGQWELTRAIWEHLCGPLARPRLAVDDNLATLLCEPGPLPRGEIGRRVKAREDKLDALVCAYTAAWLDAERPLQGLGEVGKGVMITPRRRDIAPALG